ncbi:MAG: CoB--CoM heterodisulfide reductase iron-sulfur subunit A family protein [Bacteroidales bacterium OttesenSCG-928-I14]|jgi:heterodisulfide reductase subunit A|nr:CoB--CoM heterodisulfide reductase iron-sulfur subunit A family protein [Bacteroidales bacterium OttesenSCG-928-I14]
MSKIGVFVCHCGENIDSIVDCEKVAMRASKLSGVVFSVDYKYMCSDPGQNKIKEAVKKYGLTGVVIAACSPRMHEYTFRKVCAEIGLNPYLCEIANVREHCSWVHEKVEFATQKAFNLVRARIEKVKNNLPLYPYKVPINKIAIVIGGGIAGIQSSIDIANGGYKVILIEREPSIGGRMAQLSETFPTLDCSQCILTPRMVEVAQHPNIMLYTYSEIESVDGFIGNFSVQVRKKAKSIDEKKCTTCGLCYTKCPMKKNLSEFNQGLSYRPAIYVPFPQAIPNNPVIDRNNCIFFQKGKCKICQKFCPTGAIDFEQIDEIIEIKAGAIILSTGFDIKNVDFFPEYGYGKCKDIITGMQFERLASASGPTIGEIRRPSDRKVPKKVVFISCAGSRDCAKGISYCSKICCMYTVKHAMLYKNKVPEGISYIFYMDIRAAGKNYEEFTRRAVEEYGIKYVRGRVSNILLKNEKLIVRGVDTLLNGKPIEILADLVVLATAAVSCKYSEILAQKLHIPYDIYGFFTEAHSKLKPVETNTAGIFLAGSCQFPKDIPESVVSASGAAAKVLCLFSSDELVREPIVAKINKMPPPLFSTCMGCELCIGICPYKAINKEEIKDDNGYVIKSIAHINSTLCQGCGTCVAFCKSKSIDLEGYSNKQIYEEVIALLN